MEETLLMKIYFCCDLSALNLTNFIFNLLKLPKWNKNPQGGCRGPACKERGVCFVLTSYFWAWGLFWSVVDTRSDSALEKDDFLFASRCQLQIAFWSRVRGTLCPLPPLCAGPCLSWTCAGHRYALTVSVISDVLNPAVFGRFPLLSQSFQ